MSKLRPNWVPRLCMLLPIVCASVAPAQRDQTGSAGDAQAKHDDKFHVDLTLSFYSSYVTSDES